ncbi:MAG: preprotein translocase subunit SecY, partial [Clostridia bacterium]|nr:preprotein translocase subunit SecY [Clostridia bacterium]
TAKDVATWLEWVLGIGTLLIVVASIIFVTYMSDTERRIPVQYAKRVVGRKMYGGQNSNLPIKLNMSGVMPIIFASTIVSFFPTVMYFVESIRKEEFAKGTFWYGFKHLFDSTSAVYIILLFVLIIAFAYFYISISFNPVEVSNNLMQQGGFIPGIRPGKPTAQYIKKVLNKIVLMGAFFLALIACVPLIINAVSGGLLGVVSFSGSTLLIVVGVILETVRELEAQLTMRHYKGFLE